MTVSAPIATGDPLVTSIRIAAGETRARLGLETGQLVPHLLERGAASARVGLIAAGALLLGGDRVEVRVEVGAGCRLEIDDISGTVAYDARGERSWWRLTAHVAVGGLLLWNGLPLVIADGANVLRDTQIVLEPGARACLRETIVLGRVGERGGRVSVTTRSTLGGTDLSVECLELDGGRPMPGVVGPARIIDTVQLLGARPVGESEVPVLNLDRPGALGRYLGADAHRSPLAELWTAWRGELLALEAVGVI